MWIAWWCYRGFMVVLCGFQGDFMVVYVGFMMIECWLCGFNGLW